MEDLVPRLFSTNELHSRLFGSLKEVFDNLGPYIVEEKKTSVHVVAGRSAFIGVHPRKDGHRLNLVLTRELKDARVLKCERVSAKRFHNELDLRAPSDLDAEMASWLVEAYHRASK